MVGYPELIRLDHIIQRIGTNPDFFGLPRELAFWHIQSTAAKDFEEMVRRYSSETAAPHLAPPYKPEPSQKARFEDAWDCLGRNGITGESLAAYGLLLTTSTPRTYGGEDQLPPDCIPQALEKLADDLARSKLHSVMRAVDAGIRMLQIRPYSEGTLQAAHLLQNFCLHQRGYPGVDIDWTEHEMYIHLTNAVVQERNSDPAIGDPSSIQKPTPNEQFFHHYIIGKVLSSASVLEEKLLENRSYAITVHSANGAAASIHEALRNYARDRPETGLSVLPERYVPEAGVPPMITVRGDISVSELRGIINRSHSRKQYEVEIRPARRP